MSEAPSPRPDAEMTGSAHQPDGALETAISQAVSRLYLDQFDKGPVEVQTHVDGEVITTVMRSVLTVAERAMIANGRADSVLSTRMLWQHAADAAFKAAIEPLAGRRVLSVVSGFHLDDDLATEVFILAP